MKTKKLLKKVREYLDSDRREQIKRSKSIGKVLKELKEYERALKDELHAEENEKDCEPIQKEIDVIRAQRKKGLAILKEIKRTSKENSAG